MITCITSTDQCFPGEPGAAPMSAMRRILPAGLLVLFAATPAIAQPSTIAPGDIRCPDCAQSGQKPAPAAFDPSQIEFVANPIPAFHENKTFRITFIVRVVQAAPLVLDVLDSQSQALDRNMRVVDSGTQAADDTASCATIGTGGPIDLASKAVVASLQWNDIVTGDVIMNRSKEMPDALLAATPTMTNLRKAVAPVPFFHAVPARPDCANRSGRLVEYRGPEDGELTIVYNDGGLYYRNGAYYTFTKERLAPAEIADLLRAFRDANFDALPSTLPQTNSANRPSLALLAARYQWVAPRDGDTRLASLLTRLDALAARATSHARYVVKSVAGVPIVVKPWPYADVDLARLGDTRALDAARDAFQQTVPADFLGSLPAESIAADDGDSDPNRLVYFAQAGRLYRVVRSGYCTASPTCSFRHLNAAEVTEPLAGACAEGTRNCQTYVYAGGRKETRLRDPNLTTLSGRLWPRSLGVKLRDVTPSGLTFSADEFKRHADFYFPLMKMVGFGATYIEDGILYAHVRVCMSDEGADASACDLA